MRLTALRFAELVEADQQSSLAFADILRRNLIPTTGQVRLIQQTPEVEFIAEEIEPDA